MAKLGKSQREKDLVRVACVAPFRDGLLLFGKRGDDGKWNLPGGHLEPGEDPEDGARRELMEESGYGDLRGDLKYIGKGDIPERNLTVYCFRAEVPDHEPTAENDPDQEMVDWRWVDPDEIPAEILDNLHNKQDVTLQLLGLQQGRFSKAEADLEKMAIRDLTPGKKMRGMDKVTGAHQFDYTHLLSPEQKAAGYQMKILAKPADWGEQDAHVIRAGILHPTWRDLAPLLGNLYPGEVGFASGHIAPGKSGKYLHIGNTEIRDPKHMNKGLGVAMYEAMMTHAMKRHQANVITSLGEKHSTSAKRVHEALARKHGLGYEAEPAIPNMFSGEAKNKEFWENKTPGPYDDKYGPYEYAIKSEEDLGKMAQIDQTQNPEFRKWFKGSKIKHPETGKPLTVYHGTTHDFNSFSHKKGNPENYYGRAHYFTSHPSDVENYAGEGPDLKARLEQATEHHPIFPENPAAAKDAARKQLVGPGPRVIPAHLNLKNPVDVRPNGGTMFHIDQDFDEDGEPVGEPKGNGVKLMEAIKAVAPRYHLNPHELLLHIHHSLEHDNANFIDGASAYQIERALRAHEGIAYADDGEGHNISSEVIRDIWKAAGHDGVILDAYSAFGPKKDLVHGGYYGGMPGVMPGTNHYIAFSPGQIKGAFNQTFDPRSTAFGKDEAPMTKGAMSRLQPFDPQQDISESAKDKLHAWTVDMTGARSDLPSLPPEAMTRALHKLHAATSTRRNPQTGEREFLLHRGMGTSEYKESVKDGRVRQPRRYSSWTPHQEVASYWGNLHGAEPFTTVSAWIPESKIHTVPKMAGSTEIPFPEKVPTPGPAHNAHEFEVIVRGHDSEMAHPDQVNPARDLIVKKAESTVIQNWVESLTKDEDLVSDPDDEDMNQAVGVAEDMLGFNPQARPEFEAAQFLAHSSKPAPLSLMRLALYHHEHDLEAAALTSFGLAVDDGNRAALRGVVALRKTPLGKAEAPGTVPAAADVTPALPDAAGSAAEVQRALAAHRAQPIKLNGRHSSGMIMAKDPQTQTVFLLKPGSGGQSPAKGAEQDPASQSRREAAFWAVAEAWGLGSYIPRADLIIVDGQEWAAIRMLPFSWENLDKVRAEDPGIATRVLARYRDDGVLHKWAVLDAILGNPDRHAQNLMIDGDRKQIALIDHGSAFAGDEFDPAYDRNSFVPFYLRAWSSKNFNALTVADKLRYMPRVSKPTQEVLRVWLQDLHADRLQAILHRFGIDPRPCLERLAKIKVMASSQPLDQCINRFWVTT